MSINACNTKVSMLLSLLLANKEFYHAFSCFFLDLLNNFLVISVVREKLKVKFALGIPAGVPKILVNEHIDTPTVVALETIKILFL